MTDTSPATDRDDERCGVHHPNPNLTGVVCVLAPNHYGQHVAAHPGIFWGAA